LPLPDVAAIEWFAPTLSIATLIAIARLRLGTVATLAPCALAGPARIAIP
jgi:hypothetical protein